MRRDTIEVTIPSPARLVRPSVRTSVARLGVWRENTSINELL